MAGAGRRRMLLVVNPSATRVTTPALAAVVRSLRAGYDLDVARTSGPGHATALARAAAVGGCDVVAALSGDGTANEVANGLAGSATALAPLPGGAGNVFVHLVGVPADLPLATERLVAAAGPWAWRSVDLGRANGRHFVAGSGVGVSASVVRRVDARPRRKAAARQWYFAWTAALTFATRYLVAPPRMRVEAGDDVLDGITAIVQNGHAFTFFGPRPIPVALDAGLGTGTLGMAVLRAARPADLVTLSARLLAGRPGVVAAHPRVAGLGPVRSARVSSLDGRPFPLEVDGDDLGDVDEVLYEVAPRALRVLQAAEPETYAASRGPRRATRRRRRASRRSARRTGRVRA